jgi:hypothetical protein
LAAAAANHHIPKFLTDHMQVKLLNQAFDQYKQFLQSPQADRNLYIWESQQIFQDNWNLEVGDLAKMYDQSLQNSQTRRLWRRESYEPKDTMLQFIGLSEDYFLQMFTDLFDEDKSIDGRVDRFVFYCDQLLEEYRSRYPHRIDNNHYHDNDYQMISLYLAFRFPDAYTLYNGNYFRSFLDKMGVVNLPLANDFPRFVKVSRTVHKLMQKDAELMDLHRRRLQEGVHYMGESLLVVYDLMEMVVKE